MFNIPPYTLQIQQHRTGIALERALERCNREKWTVQLKCTRKTHNNVPVARERSARCASVLGGGAMECMGHFRRGWREVAKEKKKKQKKKKGTNVVLRRAGCSVAQCVQRVQSNARSPIASTEYAHSTQESSEYARPRSDSSCVSFCPCVYCVFFRGCFKRTRARFHVCCSVCVLCCVLCVAWVFFRFVLMLPRVVRESVVYAVQCANANV